MNLIIRNVADDPFSAEARCLYKKGRRIEHESLARLPFWHRGTLRGEFGLCLRMHCSILSGSLEARFKLSGVAIGLGPNPPPPRASLRVRSGSSFSANPASDPTDTLRHNSLQWRRMSGARLNEVWIRFYDYGSAYSTIALTWGRKPAGGFNWIDAAWSSA